MGVKVTDGTSFRRSFYPPLTPPAKLCLTHISGISGGGLGKVVAAEQVIEVLQTAP